MNTDHKFVFLNGPPRAGKDSIALGLQQRSPGNVVLLTFARAVKNGTHAALGLDKPYNFYENVKDIPHDDFYGLTPRQAYIKFSENYMKPTYGNSIFGGIALRNITEYLSHTALPKLVVITDCGFDVELVTFIKEIPVKNIFLFHIHREGCDFSNDSRSYIKPLDGVNFGMIKNVTGKLQDTVDTIFELVNKSPDD